MVERLPLSLSALGAQFDGMVMGMWEERWKAERRGRKLRKVDSHTPGSHLLCIHSDLRRRHSSLLTQLRTGLSHLNADLFKIRVAPSPHCDCGERETREHLLLACPLFRAQRNRMRSDLAAQDLGYMDVSSLLSIPEAIPIVLRFVTDTGRFPRYHASLEPKGGGRKEKEKGKGGGKVQGKVQGGMRRLVESKSGKGARRG